MVDVQEATVSHVYTDEERMLEALVSYLDKIYPELSIKTKEGWDGYTKLFFRYLSADEEMHPRQMEISRVADAYKAGWRNIVS